jgi:hypothetical protein
MYTCINCVNLEAFNGKLVIMIVFNEFDVSTINWRINVIQSNVLKYFHFVA